MVPTKKKTNKKNKQTKKLKKQQQQNKQTKQTNNNNGKNIEKKKIKGGCRQTYRPERPKGAKDEVKRPFLPFLPILPILHFRGVKPAAAKPAASKADYSRPRQTIVDQGRPWQTKAFCNPRCYQHLRCLYWIMHLSVDIVLALMKGVRLCILQKPVDRGLACG